MVDKSQEVRLIDVFVIGPALIWFSTQRKLSRPARAFLGITGALTILYNGRNYVRRQQQLLT